MPTGAKREEIMAEHEKAPDDRVRASFLTSASAAVGIAAMNSLGNLSDFAGPCPI
jgi:hypothetical protein